MSNAPLGPIATREKWRTIPGNSSHHEGKEYWYTYYTDQYRNEYNSIEHVLRCAIARALDVV